MMTALVDGVQAGQTNCEDTVDMVYLPISIGYRNCYKQYMALLGYNFRSHPNDETVVEGEDGEEVTSANFVSLKTYFYIWKRDYPSLKVSQPVGGHLSILLCIHKLTQVFSHLLQPDD